MPTTLIAPRPWPRLTELAGSTKGFVAVPFVMTGARRLLPLKAGSVLVTRADEATVKQGQIDPSELLAYLRAGVEVHARADLHAKVYVFGRRAVVGSANVSNNSATLSEACLETTEPAAVAEAKAYVLGMRTVPIGPDLLKRLMPLFPKMSMGRRRGAEQAPARERTFLVAVQDVEWGELLERADQVGTRKAVARMSDAASFRLEKVNLTAADAMKLRRGDAVIYRWGKGRGFIFEPPSLFVHAEPYEGGAIVYTETRKRQRDRTSADVREALGAASSELLNSRSSFRQIRKQATADALLRLWHAAV